MWDQKSGEHVSIAEGGDAIADNSSLQDKKIYEQSGEDSGFLSGPIPSDSYSSTSNTKDSKEISMRTDSGLDVGLSEWMCGLSLKNSSDTINNLGGCRKAVLEEPNFKKLAKVLQQIPLWEFCYSQNEDGDTKLHLAIVGKHVQAIWSIIRLAPVPALLDIRNDDAQAPLHLAVLTRQHEIVRRLLVAGAKATIPDRDGNTPLHLACINSDRACVDALTSPITEEEFHRYGKSASRNPQVLPPDLEQRNYDGEHYVHIAAQKNDIDLLRHLVWLGADINAREGRSGYTALHFACENSNQKLVEFLLTECTRLNVEACTYGLLTAYQLAAENKNKDLMCNLERFGAELLTPPESDDSDGYSDSCDGDY